MFDELAEKSLSPLAGTKHTYVTLAIIIYCQILAFVKTEQHSKLMTAWVMPKHVFKKLYRELKIFVNTVIATKLW